MLRVTSRAAHFQAKTPLYDKRIYTRSSDHLWVESMKIELRVSHRDGYLNQTMKGELVRHGIVVLRASSLCRS